MMKKQRPVLMTYCGELGINNFGQFLHDLHAHNMRRDRRPLQLVLHSPGGSESFGIAAVAALRRLRARHILVHVIGEGQISSGAVAILASGTPGHRELDRYAKMCLHLGSSDLEENVTHGGLRRWYGHIETQITNYYQLLAELTKCPVAWWRGLLDDGEDHWISPADAVTWGIADRLF